MRKYTKLDVPLSLSYTLFSPERHSLKEMGDLHVTKNVLCSLGYFHPGGLIGPKEFLAGGGKKVWEKREMILWTSNLYTQ